MGNNFYYDDKKKITSEEAHALKDKSQLIVSDKELKFEKEITTPGYPKYINAKKEKKKNGK